jgi:NAD(P) transhydrogenase subunit alpha
MNPTTQDGIAAQLRALADQLQSLPARAIEVVPGAHAGVDPFVFLLTIFLLACFVGYYVVWSVTPALHSPLMAVTNAISSVIIVGALLSVGLAASGFAGIMGFLAVLLASVNIFGGFLVAQRMLAMFKKREK